MPPRPGPDELDALLSISEALTGKLDLQQILGGALSTVEKIVGAGGSSILLIDPDTKDMSFHVAEGPGSDAAKTIPVPAGAGVCGYVARTGRCVIVNDAQNDPRLYRKVDEATSITTLNLLAVPIRSRQRLWGVLELINKSANADFSGRDLRLAGVAAGQIALALENAHLHDELVRKARMAAIGQTVSGLAHCIKNILNGIRSGSAIINRSMKANDFDRVREGWQTVRRNNDMLGTLVLDMLSLAREAKPHPFPTDINDLVGQIGRLLSDRASERGITVVCTPAEGLEEVPLDPTHLYRCVLNLVTNAVDACNEGGRVRVRVSRGSGKSRVTISVIDDGAGMSPEVRRRLFTEFFTTKGGRGTGLGLPVTRKLVSEMGGTIAFHSVQGRGSRFVIALPTDPLQEKPEETNA